MTASAPEVRVVRTPAEREDFIAVAARAQAGNPQWVSPLDMEIRLGTDPHRSPLRQGYDIEAFVAYRNGEPVGRIAAILDRAHLARHQDGSGHFGMLEAIDDREVFAALTETAAGALRAKGLAVMRGPFNVSINHETGLLVSGFDEPHLVRTNHAPPFYGQHLEALGFRKAMDLHADIGRVAEMDFPERAEAIARRSDIAREITTRGLSLRDWSQDFRDVLSLYNDAWYDNWGAVPVSESEGRFIAAMTLPMVKPSWIRLASYRGETIAVVSQIPDANEALKPLRGKLAPFGWARLMWHIHVRGTRRTRLPMIGVARRWRGSRVGSIAISLLLAEAIRDARRAGVEEIEISWMLETNAAIRNLVRSLPTRPSRIFRVYERDL